MSQGFPWVSWWIYNSRAAQFPLWEDPADETKLHGDGRQTNSRSRCRCMLCADFSLAVSEGTMPEQESTVTLSVLVLQRWLLSPLLCR